jgi:hypothetical protein
LFFKIIIIKGLYNDGSNVLTTVCGVLFQNNVAGANGGSLFRVGYSTNQQNIYSIQSSTFINSSALTGGSVFLQGMTLSITSSTISNGYGVTGSGIFFGSGANLTLTGVTIANNTGGTTGIDQNLN